MFANFFQKFASISSYYLMLWLKLEKQVAWSIGHLYYWLLFFCLLFFRSPFCVRFFSPAFFPLAFRHTALQHMVSFFPANFSLFENDSSLVLDISRALSSSEKIDLSALMQGGEELRSLSPWELISLLMGVFWAISGSFISVLFILMVSVWVLRRRIFRFIVRELGESDQFHISPSPVERPSPGPDPELSHWMNELVHRLARLWDSEEGHAEGKREEQSLVGPSGDPKELGNSCPGAA